MKKYLLILSLIPVFLNAQEKYLWKNESGKVVMFQNSAYAQSEQVNIIYNWLTDENDSLLASLANVWYGGGDTADFRTDLFTSTVAFLEAGTDSIDVDSGIYGANDTRYKFCNNIY